MTKALGDRMKAYEDEYERRIAPGSPFVVRLDGHTFSKFTAKFKKPFDDVFCKAMAMVMNDLLTKYQAVTGYTHSDEITLIFPRVDLDLGQTHPFNGRVMKIATLLAGCASARFNFHIAALVKPAAKEYDERHVARVEGSEAHFDARVMAFPKDVEIANHMIWRSIYDCHRNCVSTYARYKFGHKAIMNKNSGDLIAMMEDTDQPYDSIPLHYRHGVYAKKAKYLKECRDPKTGEDVQVVRTRVENKCFKIDASDANVDLMLAKYWDESDGGEGEVASSDSEDKEVFSLLPHSS